MRTFAKGCIYKFTKKYSGKYYHYRNELQKSQWYSREQLRELQNAKLRKVIAYAYKNVPYYQQLFDRLQLRPEDIRTAGDLKKLPFLEKETVRTQGASLVSQKMKKMLLRKAHTSGTSGKPLTLYRTLSNIVYEYATLQRQYNWGGLCGGDRVATFLGEKITPADQDTPPFWAYNKPEKKLICSSYHLSPRNANAYICALRRFKPVALEGYPSSLYTMAKFIADRIETMPVKAVFTTSETLSSDQRQLLREVFQCPVYDYYGMAERVIAIHTCDAGNYHILPEYGLVELLKISADGERNAYELIGTSLNNFAMPLIRYRLGDTVSFSDEECPCGRSYPVVKSILGRSDDYIVTSRGTMVGRLDHIFKGAQNIVEAQIIQESLDSFEMKIVPDDDFCREDGEFISDKLKERVGSDISVRINLVREIPRSRAGKLRATLSKLENEEHGTAASWNTAPEDYEKCEMS